MVLGYFILQSWDCFRFFFFPLKIQSNRCLGQGTAASIILLYYTWGQRCRYVLMNNRYFYVLVDNVHIIILLILLRLWVITRLRLWVITRFPEIKNYCNKVTRCLSVPKNLVLYLQHSCG